MLPKDVGLLPINVCESMDGRAGWRAGGRMCRGLSGRVKGWVEWYPSDRSTSKKTDGRGQTKRSKVEGES